MDRALRSREGFTLLELLIAITLGSVVLLAASNFLVNFAKYTSSFIKSEAVLTGATLAAFEEIVDKISFANKAVCGIEAAMDVPGTARPVGCSTDGSCIQIRVDKVEPTTPSNYSDDTVYNYWKSGTDLYRSICPLGVCGASSIIATGINTLSFTRVDKDNAASASYFNTIRVVLEVRASSGVTSGALKEYMDTTVVLRGKSLN
jgi:prepilin-type N-terminal cleavage/methylation domain-containing protein